MKNLGAKVTNYMDQASNGFILGIAPDLPWCYSENIRNLTNDMFCALIAKYVKKISDYVPAVQMWDCSDD